MQAQPDLSLGQKKFNNILLLLPNWIGDMILSLPSIQELHIRFPDARITTIAKPPLHELIMGYPGIDSVIKIPFSQKKYILEQIRFARNLRNNSFDLGIVLPNSFRSAAMLYLSGAKIRLGYNTEGRGLFLTHSIIPSHESKKEHRVQYFFNILSCLGLTDLPTHFNFPISAEVNDSMSDYFLRIGIKEMSFCITVHPGGSKFPRTWHAERYGILCQKLIKEYGVKIIILGNVQDTKITEKIVSGCPRGTIFSLLDLNLKETAAVIKKSRLFIGNDSGMMHLAAMVETPIVGIFGPGNPTVTGPFIEPCQQVIVTKNYSCSPCRQKFFKECKPSPHSKPYCIEDISVKDVMEAVQKILSDNLLK